MSKTAGQRRKARQRAAVEAWLDGLGATLFGRAYDLSNEESKEAAVDFILRIKEEQPWLGSH